MPDFGPEEEPGGFFRGKEAKSLLILAAIMAVGWATVFYLGRQKMQPEPPKPRAVVEVPPLPPPDPDKAFVGLRDKTMTTDLDNEARVLAFRRAREVSPDQLSALSRREVTPQALCERPKRYRGLPIHLEGYAQYVAAVDEPGFTPGGRFYEVWISVPPDTKIPCCVLVEDVPKDLPGGRNLSEKVTFDGYFLKLLSYRAVDVPRFAPLLIGRIVRNTAGGGAPTRKDSIWWTIWPVGLLFVYVGGRVAFTLRKNMTARSRPKQYFPKSDQIDPEELDAWLGEAGEEVE